MDVTMPDGTVIEGVPDGITKGQLLAKYQKMSAPAPEDTEVKYDPKTGAPYTQSERNKGVEEFTSGIEGGIKQTPFWLGDLGNSVAQGAARLGSKAYTALGGELTPEQADKITNLHPLYGSSEIMKAVGAPIQEPKNGLGVLGNLVGGAAGAAGINEAASMASSLPKNFMGNIAEDLRAPIPGKEPILRSRVRTASQNAYKAVEDSGTVLHPSVTDKSVDIIEGAKQQSAFGGKLLTSDQADINAALDEYSVARGQPMTMTDLQTLDSTLGDKAAQAYASGKSNKGRIISDVQDKIRDLIKPKNLSPEDVIGTPEGIEALTEHAIPLWSAQAKMGDILKIIERGNAMDNPSTAIKTGLRNLMLNEGKMATYSPEIQKMIRDGAKTGKTDDLLGVLGSRLNPIAQGAVGGLPGKLGAHAISSTFRAARTNLKNKQADAILGAMVEDLRPSIDKYAPLPKSYPEVEGTRLLPAPERPMTGSGSNLRAMTDDEWQSHIDLQSTPETKGLRAARADIPSEEVLNASQLRRRAIPDETWNKLNAQQQEKINSQIENMWNQKKPIPLNEMIANARRNAQYVADAKGEPYVRTPVDEAFKGAGFKNGGPVRKNLTAEFLAKTRKRA